MADDRPPVESQVSASESRLAGIIASAMDAIITVDADQRVTLFNAAAEQMFGIPAGEALGQPLDRFIPTRFRSAHHRHIEIFGRTHVTKRAKGALGELFGLRASGDEFPIEAAISQVVIDGQQFFTAAIRDMTERHRAAEELQAALRREQLLRKEIHHRVKNNLQVLSSLMFLQSTHVSDPVVQEVLNENRNRIRSIALIHERLYQSSGKTTVDLNGYLQSLITEVSHSYAAVQKGIQLTTRAEGIDLSLESAVACGLIVTELVSNALKHAYPDGRRGRVTVEARRLADGRLALAVQDDGVGLPADFDPCLSRRLGLRLVCDLVRQLEGSLQVETEGGAGFQITFADTPKPGGERQPGEA